MTTPAYATEQEAFWAGSFGDEYIGRNASAGLLASNLSFFGDALRAAGRIGSCIEFGANIGMNLRALQLLYPGIALRGIEINAEAARQLGEAIGPANVEQGSIFDHRPRVKRLALDVVASGLDLREVEQVVY